MSKDISAAQISKAVKLAAKHKEKGTYINVKSGHLNFKRNAALKLADPTDVKFINAKGHVLDLDKEGELVEKKSPVSNHKYPEGEPNKDWKVTEIRTWGKDNKVSFAKNDKEEDLLKKAADFLAAKTETPE